MNDSEDNGEMVKLHNADGLSSKGSSILPLINEAKRGFPSKRSVALN